MKVATLAATILAALLCTVGVRADDYGPPGDLATIRHAVPFLLTFRLRNYAISTSDIIIDDVAVEGNDAAAGWHARGKYDLMGIVRMEHREFGWEIAADATRVDPEAWDLDFPDLIACPRGVTGLDEGTLRDIGFSRDLLTVAHAHIALLQGPWPSKVRATSYDCAWYPAKEPWSPAVIAYGGGFVSGVFGSGLDEVVLQQYAATTSWWGSEPSNGTFYFFELFANDAAPATFAGTSLDVWCPFVLSPTAHYVLSIGLTEPDVRAIRGMIHADNVLHFDLPRFALRAGTPALGEIAAVK